MTFVRVAIRFTILLLVIPRISVAQSQSDGCWLQSQITDSFAPITELIENTCADDKQVERASQRRLIDYYCGAEIMSRSSQEIASGLHDCPELKYKMERQQKIVTVCHRTAMKALRLLHLDAEPKWTKDDDCRAAVIKARAVAQHKK
jgi:hypothetical protein